MKREQHGNAKRQENERRVPKKNVGFQSYEILSKSAEKLLAERTPSRRQTEVAGNMAGIPKYVREDMEECVIHGSGNRRESKPGERTQGIRRDIETLDTRIHSEHRRVQSMMKDLTALWDPLLELKKESS